MIRTTLTFTFRCGCGNGFSGKSTGNAPVVHIERAEFAHPDDSAIPAAIHRPPDGIGARPAP
jgi:hypothetical protein